MLVLQNINEFIKLSNNLKKSSSTANLNHSNCIVLTNKLKQINNQFCHVTSIDLCDDFFANIYCLLNLFGSFKIQNGNVVEDLLESCLDILMSCTDTTDNSIRERFLGDFRFLPVITNILGYAETNDDNNVQILIKLLTVIRELLNYSSETTEHNMKLIINSLRDYAINNDNLEVSEICLSILVNLCLKNDAAKYLITQIMKQTALKDKIKKISDNLVAFKYFILIEDEIFSNDVKYFLRMCLTDVKTSVSTFNSESINHSLDVLFHVEKAEIRLDFRISDEEDLVSMLSQLNSELIENISEDISPKKQVFYSGIFHLYNVILQLDPTLVATFENFTESIFLSTVSKSANALKFLSTFIGFDGNLASSEIVVEGLVEFFAGNPVEDDENINFTQKIAFLGLLEPLQAKEKLSDVHLNTIGDYFCHIVDTFKSAKLSSLEDEDAFFFIYFVFALSSVAKKNLVFYGRLLEVLKLDFVPMMMAKGHVSKNKEILDILFKLAAVENFPNRKISSILSRCSINSEIVEEKSTTNTKRSSDCATKFVAGQLAEEIEQLIKRINQKINSGDINNVAITDLMQLFRLKNDICNDQLTSVNEALDLSTFENGRLKQKIGTLNLLTSKQDFITWCHQLDKERLAGEGKDLTQIIKSLKNSIDAFQKKLEKKEASIHQTEKALRLKTKEIQELSTLNELAVKKFEDCKAKLMLVQKENDSRIHELKANLEKEKKSKSEELTVALTEQTKLNQKFSASEKEKESLKELVKFQESQIIEKEKENQQYELALKEAEQMKNTVMSLMQSKSFKNK